MILRQSTSVVISFGPFLDKTDGITLKTGLVSALDNASTGILLSKNGGTMAVRHATVTTSVYDAHGCYKVTLDTTDTATLGSLRVIYTDATTCLPVWADFQVVTQNEWDSVCASAIRAVNVTQLLGTAWVTPTVAGTPDVQILQTAADKVWNTTTRTLSAAGVQAIWDALSSALTTVGSIGKRLVDFITGDTYGRIGAGGINLTTLGDTRLTFLTGDAYVRIGANGAGLAALGDSRLNFLDASITSRMTPSDTLAAVTLVDTVTNVTNAPAAGDLTDAMKASVTAACSAATPAVTVTDKTGFALTSAYDAAKTAAQVSNIPTPAQVADGVLGRNLAGGSSGGRTVGSALRVLRNKVVISGSTMTVYAEDDTTIIWTGTLTTNSSAAPITGIDPA
jgi:hypothetical protein